MFSVKRLYLETKLKKNFHYFRHYSHFFEKKVLILWRKNNAIMFLLKMEEF